MKWEFQTAYDDMNRRTMDQIMGDRDIDPSTKIALLTSALPMPSFKELARSYYQVLVKSGKLQSKGIAPACDCLADLGLKPCLTEALNILPKYSWSLTFKFCLAKPYLSRDDISYYIIENPLRKDKVFMVPMIAPSQWKGALQSAIIQFLIRETKKEAFAEQRYRSTLLFGDEKGAESEDIICVTKLLNDQNPEEKERYEKKVKKHFLVDNDKALPHHAGRLRFYPTFFTKIGLEVINPHDRARKVGTNPIYFECVPAGAEAAFTLLYVPFDLMGRQETEIRAHAANDLLMVAQGLNDMFTLYGFGAKTSSGYGVAEEMLRDNGRLLVKAKDPAEKTKIEIPVEPKEPEIVHKFRESYPDEDFSENINAWLQAHNTSSKQKRKNYREAKQAYQDYLKLKEKYQTKKKNAESKPVKLTTDRMFKSFPELIEKVSDLASCWRQSNE
ncbi:MAG: hypothetical protein JRD93_11670 [Deltaproteobacteria bacterium]|nr:hypothetical protein [Deltaproteobacteria bacterium]